MIKSKSKAKRSKSLVIWLSLGLLVIAVMLSLTLGRYSVFVKELVYILFSKIAPVTQFWTDAAEKVVLNIRLPRILLACMVGGCLSAAGAAFQGVFQNPMAAPDILGASSGAAFGAALAILLSLGSGYITLFAFAFSIATVALVFGVSKRAKGKQVLTLVLSGIMVSSLFSAGTSFIKLIADPSNQLPAITYWLMGSFSGAKSSDLVLVSIPMALGLIPLFLLSWKLNLLTMGDDEAKTMGVNTKSVRIIVILCATLITAASVSVSGIIGWVGLVIPHLCRKLVGNDYRYLMPVSVILGAVFMLLVDDISRVMTATEIPIGILTAFVGAPFFLWLIAMGGRKK